MSYALRQALEWYAQQGGRLAHDQRKGDHNGVAATVQALRADGGVKASEALKLDALLSVNLQRPCALCGIEPLRHGRFVRHEYVEVAL